MNAPLVLACGPRPGGNSDLAGQLLAEGLTQAGITPRLVHPRKMDLRPCQGCQTCSQAPHVCVLADLDQTEELYSLILQAPMVFFASPIYFYHLPGGFKCFMDRAQRYYQARLAGDPALNPRIPRLGQVCLVAGRERGENLFTGALLSLRYFLWALGLNLGDPLCLPGLDGPRDLAGDRPTQERIRQYAREAWHGLAR